jgi:serine/threonine protein kinase
MRPHLFSVPKEGQDAYLYKPNKDHLIGKGGFATIFRATRKHDQGVFAIKRSMLAVELLDEKEQQAVLDEIRLMKEYPHPFIVKVIDDFVDNAGHQCMVQELYTQGDFSTFLYERREA